MRMDKTCEWNLATLFRSSMRPASSAEIVCSDAPVPVSSGITTCEGNAGFQAGVRQAARYADDHC